ncbi:MAG: MerR family transcriptional regulator [Acidimicrobiales bacterium]|jgi:DNA-binding transcriptional MerR regulator|nr:MerR family transcriptional regulator [Acidimicrobiales bacterium]
MTDRGAPYTIEDLEQRVAARLREVDATQPNGQVSQRPDRRTLRYYTTLGLLDRPSEVRGRRAWYGERHVEQVLAIKRLQAAGLPLAEIQSLLVGRPTRELTALAATFGDDDHPVLRRLGVRPHGAGRSTPAGERPGPPAPPEAFWRRRPQSPSPSEVSTGIPLGDGVVVLVPGSPVLDATTLHAIRDAAAPLLAALARLDPRPDPDPAHPDTPTSTHQEVAV